METKGLRSAIEIYPIICRILSYVSWKQGSSNNRHDAAMREDSSVSKDTFMEVVALYGCLCYQNSKYLKDIQKEKQDGLELGRYSRYMRKMRRQNSAILDQLVITIVLDTVANENAAISIAAIFCSVTILHFTDQLQATELPTARNFHNLLRPKCVIKLCVAIVCDCMETTLSVIRDRLRSSAIVCDQEPRLTVKPGQALPL